MTKPRVLIADDEKTLRSILYTVLDEAGYEVASIAVDTQALATESGEQGDKANANEDLGLTAKGASGGGCGCGNCNCQ